MSMRPAVEVQNNLEIALRLRYRSAHLCRTTGAGREEISLFITDDK